MHDDDIRALATSAFARFNDHGGRDAFFDAYDPDVALHGYPGDLQGLDGLRRFHEALWGAFPDARLTVEDLIVEGDRVALRYRLPSWPSCGSSEPSRPTRRSRATSGTSPRVTRRRPTPPPCGWRSARPTSPSRRTVDAQRRCRRER